MWLTSSDVADKGTIRRVCACEGDSLSPALWGEAHPETRGYALICNDPDAPGGVFRHWAAYDIPATAAGLARGEGRARHDKQAVNNFGRPGCGGPCPPRGHCPRRYRFRLLALSIDRLLPVGKGARCRDVEQEAQKDVLAEAELVGTFER